MKHIRSKVFPGWKSEKIEEIEPNRYRVYLREVAKDNAANKRLLLVLAEHLQIDPQKLHIISGHKQQNKILEIWE